MVARMRADIAAATPAPSGAPAYVVKYGPSIGLEW